MTVQQRPATRADLPGILELWLAFDTAVRGFPDSDEADVTHDWDVPGFDLDTCTLVLEDTDDGGRIVGYAVVNGKDCDSTVLPSRFGSGLEEQLLDWLERAAAPGTSLEHYVPVVLPGLEAVFAKRGWQPARTFWRMRVDHTGRVHPPPVWPEGVRVRDFDVDRDAGTAYRLVQTAFADIGGHTERTWEEWSTTMLDPQRLDPQLYLVAEQDGEVVGVALSQDLSGDFGYVPQLAVPRAHRGRGLGRALLLECFARHAARGLPQTQLAVDAANRTGATGLYESVGMRVTEEFTRWEKAGAGSPAS